MSDDGIGTTLTYQGAEVECLTLVSYGVLYDTSVIQSMCYNFVHLCMTLRCLTILYDSVLQLCMTLSYNFV